MQSNPYSSTEPELGPLMRDIKNKICQEVRPDIRNVFNILIDFPFSIQCELVAILENDTGMELLVCNMIMSLDMLVRDVYRKVSESKFKPSFRRTHPIVMICRSFCLKKTKAS